MNIHLGLLDKQPSKNRTLKRLRRGRWFRRLSPKVEHELRVWLAMPGFSTTFHERTLGVSEAVIRQYQGDFERLKDEVMANWASATREDCIALANMRPWKGDIPMICQFQIMDDLKKDFSQAELARTYRTNLTKVTALGKGIMRIRSWMPPSFAAVVGAQPKSPKPFHRRRRPRYVPKMVSPYPPAYL